MSLAGKRVLVTRASKQASKMTTLLTARGAVPVVVPMLELLPPSDPAPMAEALANVDRYDWIVFTSANGVEAVGPRLGRARIAAVGPGTAEALARVDLVPAVHKGDDLAAELARTIAPGARVLVARAEVARDVVPDALRAAGCLVDVVAVYRTAPAPDLGERIDAVVAELAAGTLDAVTFTSSSTVDHLVAALGTNAGLLARTCVASIGPITTATAEAHGLRVDVTAGEHTVPGLVAALETYLAGVEAD